MAGELIVIEGLDGSGKATQAQKLYETLSEKGERVMKVFFPDYESNSSGIRSIGFISEDIIAALQ